jgi:tetratricopeptide (TPR) repeat protein
MKKKDWIYILVFVVILGGIILATSDFSQKRDLVDIEIETPSENSSTTEDGTGTEGEGISEIDETRIPQEYFDLLEEARDLAVDGKYNRALEKIDEAGTYHVGFQLYVALHTVYDFAGDIKKKADALHEVVYTYGILEARYWRNYALAVVQSGGSETEVRKIYEDAIGRMLPSLDAIGVNQLVDMYTAYSGYLAGVESYEEAIDYLEKAKQLDSARSDVYDGEVEYLRTKL